MCIIYKHTFDEVIILGGAMFDEILHTNSMIDAQ